YLTDPVNPCDIDNLLVVTFTRAAAAEMKERIGRAIREALDEDPENAHLQRQSTLIHNAQITTIDGFCSWIVRNYCYRTELEPGFRVGEEGELKLLSADVMEEVLDFGYGSEDPDFKERFRQLSETFAVGKSDKPLEEAILKVANAAESQPWPKIWMAECRKNNQAGSMEILESLPWMAHFSVGAERKILEGLALARENLALAESPEGPSAYLEAARSYADHFEALAETISLTTDKTNLSENKPDAVPGTNLSENKPDVILSEAKNLSNGSSKAVSRPGTYTCRQQLLMEFSPAALGRKKALAGEIPELRETFKERRAAIDSVRKQLQTMYAFKENESLANMQINEAVLNTLLDAASLYMERFAEKKRERHLVDFADLEHFALEILRGKPEEAAAAGAFGVSQPVISGESRRLGSPQPDASGAAKDADRGSELSISQPIILGRTEVAKELARRFREVLVDEYQDSNDLQEAILTAVSRIEDGGRNYFCVGDVKQSIYGFRNAHPDLFMEKFSAYTPVKKGKQNENLSNCTDEPRRDDFCHSEEQSDEESRQHGAIPNGILRFAQNDRTTPERHEGWTEFELLRDGRFVSPARRGTRIDLLKNFRSRQEVLSAANGIFRQVMIPEVGGVSYDDDAALVFGAEGYPEDAGGHFTAELLAVAAGETDEEGEKLLEETGADAKRELEARAIGERILRMIRYERIWDEKGGQMRPVEFRDIVILLRTMQGWAEAFAKVLESMGIRAYSTAKSGYFSATEVALVLDYLAIV
ncbi:MAG: UvrD-helicase domain-containing protein, partial [bacterium]